MKKSIFIGSLILTSSLALANGTYAATSTTTNPGLPPEFSILTSSELTSLSTMTDTERTTFLTSKGITRPTMGSGSMDGQFGEQPPVFGSGNVDGQNGPEGLTLTTAEKTALATMTDTERDAFFASKGLIKPTGTGTMNGQLPLFGSGNTIQNRFQARRNNLSQSGTTLVTKASTTATDRTAKIVANKAKNLEARKTKIQNKIDAGEELNRLEKKFADVNGLEY